MPLLRFIDPETLIALGILFGGYLAIAIPAAF